MYTKPIPQPVVLLLIATFTVLGFLAGLNKAEPEVTTDLNHDGEVTLQDFSIALYLVDTIKKEISN